MATKYFNKHDRDRMMVLALLISRLPDIIDNFSNNLMDNKQRGRVKAAHKHLDTVFNEIVKSVDLQQRKQLQTNLDLAGFAISGGSACTAGSLEPSHVLIAMFGKDSPRIVESIRVSFGTYTTAEEVQAFGDALIKIANRLHARANK